jgi:HAD superfamily hydrolase (TIGR01509 family)
VLRAVIWDVDGTLAETERDGHRVAFNRAFDEHGLAWHWDRATYGGLLAVTGGFERLLHDMRSRDDAPASIDARIDLARRLHATKNAAYARIVAGGEIALRPGVRRLIAACADAGIAQAIATTTSRANVDALLTGAFGPAWSDRFAAVVCAEDAPAKKPDPLAYRIALERLGIDGTDAVAIEDSPNGLDAANAAGIATLITRSDYFRDADFSGAAAVCDDLDRPIVSPRGMHPQVDLDALCALVMSAVSAGGDAQGPPRDR